MISVVIALFFAGACALAVVTISQSLAGSVERFDALFAQYRTVQQGREVRGEMRPVIQYTAAPAPSFARHNVVMLSRRTGGAGNVSPVVQWRAAA